MIEIGDVIRLKSLKDSSSKARLYLVYDGESKYEHNGISLRAARELDKKGSIIQVFKSGNRIRQEKSGISKGSNLKNGIKYSYKKWMTDTEFEKLDYEQKLYLIKWLQQVRMDRDPHIDFLLKVIEDENKGIDDGGYYCEECGEIIDGSNPREPRWCKNCG